MNKLGRFEAFCCGGVDQKESGRHDIRGGVHLTQAISGLGEDLHSCSQKNGSHGSILSREVIRFDLHLERISWAFVWRLNRMEEERGNGFGAY